MGSTHTVIELIVPKRGEHKVHLDEDTAEGQHAAQSDQYRRRRKPALLRYEPRDRVDSARIIRRARPVAAEDRTDNG